MANAGQSRDTSVILWLSGIVVIGLIFFGVRRLTRDVVEVRVVPVTYQTLSSTVSTNGKVEPIEDFQAHAPFAGSIKQIFVSVGQQVSKGTLLVKMDDADARGRVAGAQARLANDQLILRDLGKGGSTEDLSRFGSDITSATLEQQHAATELETRKKLLSQGAASPAEVAAAQQRLDAANLTLQNAQKRSVTRYNAGDLENARSRVADSQAALTSAEDNLNNVDIRSPIDGTVYNIPVNQFDWVQFAEPILDVANLKRLQIRAYFDEPEIGKLAAGQPVKIVWDAKRDEVWHGHVSLAPTTIFAYNTRSVGICLITVDDPTPDLIPNTNVTVTVTESERAHVLSIPREALHTDGARSYVYRIVDGKLAQTTIKTGAVTLTNVEILSGLKESDMVVTGAKTSLTELSNGLEVKQVQ
jgi:HlyD family secretion protein